MATKKLPRFDDGGYVDELAPIDTSWADQYYVNDNSGPSASDIANLTSNATTGANSIQAQVGSNPAAAMDNPAGTSGSSGALSKVLSNLGLGGGNTSNTAALNAAVGLLSAYGKYKSNSAGTKLPNMPALGALPTLPGSNTAGYGPSGGYGYQNYQGANSGLGYAPRGASPAVPAPSYFTYGSGPEHQFFQQVTGKGGPITPVTMANGGPVPNMGGMIPSMGARQMGGMLGSQPQMLGPAPQAPVMQAPQQPQAPVRPPVPQGAPPAPMGAPQPRPPSTMMQRMQAAKPAQPPRPFAHGGQAQGALHAAMNPGVSRHVTGPGDGTSDSIPARLANGEYVMDAQLVSMLGNGDNSAGAKRLDEFRKNVRAHKGSALAKGKMAPDAKPLHKYMGGQ